MQRVVMFYSERLIYLALLYCEGELRDKADLLFDILDESNQGFLIKHAAHVLEKLEHICYIPTVLLSGIIEEDFDFTYQFERDSFRELRKLFSCNGCIVHEFVLSLSVHVIFKKKLANSRLSREEFLDALEEVFYFVVTPDYLRVKTAEYVNFHRALALQPAESQRDTRVSQKRRTLNKANTPKKRQGTGLFSAEQEVAPRVYFVKSPARLVIDFN